MTSRDAEKAVLSCLNDPAASQYVHDRTMPDNGLSRHVAADPGDGFIHHIRHYNNRPAPPQLKLSLS